MITVYTEKITSRNSYIFNLFFREILGAEVCITDNKAEFKNSEGAKINYSTNPIDGSIQFAPAEILFLNRIDEINIDVFQHEGLPAFFQVKGGELPFDPFAAGFYLVTRYEEYLPHKKDKHGRFDAEQSLAFKKQFLTLPVLDAWALKIKSIIEHAFLQIKFQPRKYQYQSTIDIDNAFAYKGKGLLRTIGGGILSTVNGQFSGLKERLNVVAGKHKDPYDTFGKLFRIHKTYGLKPKYFFLLGDYSEYDKNVPYTNSAFQSLVKSIADYYPVAIHPSYASNSEPWRIELEKKRLQDMVHQNITCSRQHFIKLSLPDTYRNLLKAGIERDYSMGYPNQLGFRAGIATPFYFYDLDQEETTPLKIHPFQVMEVTLNQYLKLKPSEALEHIQEIIDNTKKVKGTFCTIWHNESLSEKHPWGGWRKIYEEVIKAALP